MRYEFINPSDPIVFEATSDEVAALAALVVGRGKCSAKRDQPGADQVVGFQFLAGDDGGYSAKYGRSVGDGLTALAADVVVACQSFQIREGAVRTSLSDWCRAAHSVQQRQPV